MLLALKNSGVPISPGKTVGPSTDLEFLGIILDSLKSEARLPADKLVRLREDLNAWSTKSKASLVELQSLIGTLNFACTVVPPGRAFLQRIIRLTVGWKKSQRFTKLSKEFFADIAMWKGFLNS